MKVIIKIFLCLVAVMIAFQDLWFGLAFGVLVAFGSGVLEGLAKRSPRHMPDAEARTEQADPTKRRTGSPPQRHQAQQLVGQGQDQIRQRATIEPLEAVTTEKVSKKRTVEQNANPRAGWVPSTESVTIAGRNIGGMVYVGTAPRLNNFSYEDKCRAYIDPSLSVAPKATSTRATVRSGASATRSTSTATSTAIRHPGLWRKLLPS